MPFNREHIVISMMAAVDIKELVSLVGKVDESRIVRTVPLPSNSQRTGMLGHKLMVVSRTVLVYP
jgi:pyrroline-5-carboxylate reductase